MAELLLGSLLNRYAAGQPVGTSPSPGFEVEYETVQTWAETYPPLVQSARFGSVVRGAGGDNTGGTFRRDPVRENALL